MQKPFHGNFPITQGMLSTGAAKTGGAHNGIDYGLPEGTPVLAAAAGIVSQASNDEVGGIFVKIKSAEYSHEYFHLKEYSVLPGQSVKAGEKIGISGKSGLVTGPHLHFQVRRSGNFINPSELFKEEKNPQLPTERSKSIPETHTIEKGDTLWDIEEKWSLPHGSLQKLNPKIEPKKLKVGSIIVLKTKKAPASPQPSKTYKVQSGDNFWALETKFNIPHGTLKRLNPKLNPRFVPVGAVIRIRK